MTNGVRSRNRIVAILVLVFASAMALSVYSQEEPPPEGAPPPEAPPPLEPPPMEPPPGVPPPEAIPPTPATPTAAVPGVAETNAASAEAAAAASLRDPFWPVGYVPAAKRQAAVVQTGTTNAPVQPEAPEWDAAMKKLELKGIMKKGAGYVAVINNEVVRPKDGISVTFNNRKYFWIISDITQKGVKFQRDKVQ